MRIFIILLLISNMAIGDDNAVHLLKGNVAPFEGLLLTMPNAQDTRVKLLEKDQLDAINTSLQKSLDLYKANEVLYTDQITMCMNQNDKLAKATTESDKASLFRDILIFIAGSAVTTLLVFGVRKANQ